MRKKELKRMSDELNDSGEWPATIHVNRVERKELKIKWRRTQTYIEIDIPEPVYRYATYTETMTLLTIMLNAVYRNKDVKESEEKWKPIVDSIKTRMKKDD